MPDEPKPDNQPTTNGQREPGATTTGTGKAKPGMNETQIRSAGLAIDVPFESGQPAPERLRYADLGKTWTPPDGWPPEEGSPPPEEE